MNAITLALSFIASLASTPAVSTDIIVLGRIGTVVPVVSPRRGTHQAKAPVCRYVISRVGNKVTRTLAGDKSGQTVTYER